MIFVILFLIVLIIYLAVKETKCPYCGGDSIGRYDENKKVIIWKCLRCGKKWVK